MTLKSCAAYAGLAVLVVLTLIVAALTLLIAKHFSPVKQFHIKSQNMAPLLITGDYIVSLVDVPDPIPRGMVAVYSVPDDPTTKEDDSAVSRVARIVAIGGDTVELKGKQLTINGTIQNEPYAQYDQDGVVGFPARKVPDGHVFILGDNRDRSKDSRFWSNPFIPKENVSGRVVLILWNSTIGSSRMGRIEISNE